MIFSVLSEKSIFLNHLHILSVNDIIYNNLIVVAQYSSQVRYNRRRG